MSARVTIFDATFDALTADQTVDAVFDLLAAGGRGWLCTVNVSTLMMMRKDATLRAFAARARLVVADGEPLVWCSRLFGTPLPERVAGIELIDALCARAVREGRAVYLLGATAPLLERAMQALRTCHPGLRVAGADGYFTADEAVARADAIRASRSALLLVGMGVPRQEIFIDQQWERLGVGMAIGVGGSFDVLGGARFRAPHWLRRIGLEWVVRLVQEPVRLLPRYAATNSMFCWLLAQKLLTRTKSRAAPAVDATENADDVAGTPFVETGAPPERSEGQRPRP